MNNFASEVCRMFGLFQKRKHYIAENQAIEPCKYLLLKDI